MKYNFKWKEIKDAKWIFVVGSKIGNKVPMMLDIAKHISENSPIALKVNSGFYNPTSEVSFGYQRLGWISNYLQMHTNAKDSVVIEEIDSLIDAQLQRNLPEYLLKQGGIPPKRLIVSISNPLILLGAPKGSVIIHIQKNEDTEKLEASLFDIDNVSKYTPNILYTCPLFDVEGITSDNLVNFGDVRTEDTYQKMLENDELNAQLKELAKKYRKDEDEQNSNT